MWKCHKCGKPVYFAERKQSLGYDWHPECLRCEECGKRLNPGQHAEHKGVPYCHVPCYGALFGPQLFGHGTRVESHKNFGQKGTPRASGGPALPRDHLDSKLKLYNQFYDNKSMEIRSREVNNRLVLEGALRVYWGVHGVIHLKEDDDQRTVVTVRKRNSCRLGNSVEIKNGDDHSDKENDNTDTGIETSTSSIMDGDTTDISLSESMTFETCSLSEDTTAESMGSSEENSPLHKAVTLPTKLDVKNIDWDEIDDLLQVKFKIPWWKMIFNTRLGSKICYKIDSWRAYFLTKLQYLFEKRMPYNTNSSSNSNKNNNSSSYFTDYNWTQDFFSLRKYFQVERKVDETEKLYQTMPSPLPSQSSSEETPKMLSAQSSVEDVKTINSPQKSEKLNTASDEATLKPMDFEDFKKSVHEDFINGTIDMIAANENSLKQNQPIDPSRINDSLKLYSENIMSKSFNCEAALRTIDPFLIHDTLSLTRAEISNSRNYSLQKSESASSRRSPFLERKSLFEKGINRSKSGPNCFVSTDSEDETTLRPQTMRRSDASPKYINIKMDCYDQSEDVSKASDTCSITCPSTSYETTSRDVESDARLNSHYVTEDGVVLRRRPKTGPSAIKRRSGNKRSRAKLKRRCSINGHFYNRETSFFTPPHGSQMSVWVTSLVNSQEVINLLLEKYKVDSRAENFALFIVRDNGEQRRLKDEDYPLIVRVMLGPHEDVARIFLMDAQETQEISSEVAQFLNLSLPECCAILDRYNEELDREVMKVREKYAELRRRIVQRMESLKVRL